MRHFRMLMILFCFVFSACSQQGASGSDKMQIQGEQPRDADLQSEGYSEVDATEDFIDLLMSEHGQSDGQKQSGMKIQNANQVNLIIDGTTINLTPRPIIENGSTLIPIRAISTHFGGGVWWNGETRTVGINKGDTSISFVVGASVARVNGRQVAVPPSRIVNDSTFVPIRFISETFGYKVGWNGQTRTVTIDTTPNTYTVVSGDTLFTIARRFNKTVDELRTLNNLTSNTIKVGQTLLISGQAEDGSAPPQEQGNVVHYTVVSGDSLSRIAARFNTTVEAIKAANYLTSDQIAVNQVLQIPTTEGHQSPPTSGGVTKTFTTHTVQSGDNAWNLSIKYGIPMLEMLQANHLSINSPLRVGQKLTIPVYQVPVKPVVSSRHGELLDWWTEARYVFSTGKDATITDFNTGRTFRVRHTMGGNHADSEPLTSADAEAMRQIWGGNYSWTPRAVIVSVDGRKIAAAMHSFPHGDQTLRNNNYSGHFCIHFLNSTRHNDGLVQASMQSQVRISAGVK